MFSIIIPSWNNLAYLKKCVESIRKNSSVNHEIIVHVNDGSDGTLIWVKESNIKFTHSNTNVGICYAVNWAASRATNDYIVYMNDDMYVLPNWDTHIIHEIKLIGHDLFMLSSTMIEPTDHQNPCVIVENYGTCLETFKEHELINNFEKFKHFDWSGSAWPPTIVHRDTWHIVGGYSIELSPGMSSDDDFAMKLWNIGCRIFKGISASRVYHFQAKSTLRVKKNNGRKQFLMKWGINQSTFNKYFLKRGNTYSRPLSIDDRFVFQIEKARAWLKRKIF
jgi:glycosyltransferase involved in cell wall biosynthesis